MNKKGKWVFPVVSILVIALLVALPKIIGDRAEDSSKSASVLTSKVELRSIDTTLSGTGTLTAEDSVEIEVPYGVEVTRYLVSNGETVTKGQALVAVDRISAMEAISRCKETLDYIESEMFAEEYNTAARYLTVPSSGTVTAIYAEKGDRVEDVMLEYGCLATVDIGGQEWRFEAITGKVDSIDAKVGQTVYAGTTVFYLSGVEENSQYDVYLAQHKEYEDMMETLVRIYQDGVISAPCDGVVGDIDDDKVAKLEPYDESYDENELEDINPANGRPSGFPGGMQPSEGMQLPEGMEFPEGMQPPEGVEFPEGVQFPGFPGNSGTFGGQSGEPVSAEPAAYSGEKILRVSSLTYTGTVDDIILADTIADAYEIATGVITNNNTLSIDGVEYDIGSIGSSWLSNANPGDEFELHCSDKDSEGRYGTIEVVSQTKDAEKEKLQHQLEEMMNGQGTGGMGNMSDEDMKAKLGGMSGFSGMGGFGGGGMSMGSSSGEETFEMYSLDGKVIMTVTPQDTLSISITIDELDILSVSVGQEAEITIDAIPGKNYSGTVTEINTSGTSNSGGNSKYTAVVAMDRTENLIAGMNASTLITIGTAENVLAVPVKALVEKNGKTVVYTGYDDRNGELINPKEVTTGVSDGEYAEITSGLSEGDTVRYEYYDKIDIDTFRDSSAGLGNLFGRNRFSGMGR